MSGISFSTGRKMVTEDPALHRSYVERGYSVVVGGTAYVGHILIGFARRYVQRKGPFTPETRSTPALSRSGKMDGSAMSWP